MGQSEGATVQQAIADALETLVFEVTYAAQLLRMAATSLIGTEEARAVDGFEAVALLLDSIADRGEKAL